MDNLKDLLTTIQDIKSENDGLIGTQDIYRMLKGQRKAYDGPGIVAQIVNEEVQKTFTRLTYEANSRRITGLYRMLLFGVEEKINGLYEYEFIAKLGAPRFDRGQIEFTGKKEQLNEAARWILPIFMEANLEEITDDEEIGYIVINLLKREYESVRDKIEDNLKDRLDNYVQGLFKELSIVDWKDETSHQSKIEDESFNIKRFTEEAFNLNKMIERVKKDQMEHKLEYRRCILSHVFSEDPHNGLLQHFGLHRTWDYFVISYDDKIQRTRTALEDLKKFRDEKKIFEDSDAVEWYLYCVERAKAHDREPKTLDEEIKECEDRLESLIFVRRLLDQEKNWVNKVLRN